MRTLTRTNRLAWLLAIRGILEVFVYNALVLYVLTCSMYTYVVLNIQPSFRTQFWMLKGNKNRQLQKATLELYISVYLDSMLCFYVTVKQQFTRNRFDTPTLFVSTLVTSVSFTLLLRPFVILMAYSVCGFYTFPFRKFGQFVAHYRLCIAVTPRHAISEVSY